MKRLTHLKIEFSKISRDHSEQRLSESDDILMLLLDIILLDGHPVEVLVPVEGLFDSLEQYLTDSDLSTRTPFF